MLFSRIFGQIPLICPETFLKFDIIHQKIYVNILFRYETLTGPCAYNTL